MEITIMSKTKDSIEQKQAKKLNKLTIKKETIADLNVPDADQVKGGERTYSCKKQITQCYSICCLAINN